MSTPHQVPNMGLTLFPPPPSKKSSPSRKLSVRKNGLPISKFAELGRAKSPEGTDGRQSAMSSRHSVIGGQASGTSGRNSALDGRLTVLDSRSQQQQPNTLPSTNPFRMEQPRSHTSLSFSEAPILVRSHSSASHSSIAKRPFPVETTPLDGEPSNIRSMFPVYNPELPLGQQQYYPTQASPTHIPQHMISRAPYSPDMEDRSHMSRMRSPLSAPPTVTTFSKSVQIQEPPRTIAPSSTEELKELWKVTNGWRVSQSEARSFCMKMTSSVETPVHVLSSATQPFYTFSFDPTSTSALLSVTRLDPYKSARSSPTLGGRTPTGLDVLSTTLEEDRRRFPPQDGLVALLHPKAASEMAADLLNKPNTSSEAVMAATENECARLVWDDDSKRYYLCHPAMSSPFSIQIESSPAWSRVEYTLEHPELRQNLVKLTRDGVGGGFLEVDTGTAALINSFYIVDVAISAVIIVAVAEEKRQKIERFDAPPVSASLPPTPKPRMKKEKAAVKIEEMEMDLESQSSITDKKREKSVKLPVATRGIIWFFKVLFKLVVWVFNLALRIVVWIMAKL